MSKRTRSNQKKKEDVEEEEEEEDQQEEEKGDAKGKKLTFTWKKHDGLLYGDCGTKPSDKILSFDMDDTLIKVKSGKRFAKDTSDWEIYNDKVLSCVKDYADKGYKICIMTNQGGIEKGHSTPDQIQKKIENVVNKIGVPIQVFISPYKDYYRKPSPGMWRFMAQKMNGDVKIDSKESIYCGDAAGRPKEGTRKADHDITDYKFALNAGVQFKTPEMLYLNAKETLPTIEWNPKSLKTSGNIIDGVDNDKIASDSKEMIVFCGPPGSGKSTLWKGYLSDYVRVNNDTLKTKEKCLKVAREALEAGKSCVIDNTNPDKAARKPYIDLAKEYKYPVRCFYYDIPKDLSFHLDDLRKCNIHRKHQSGAVGKMVVHTWYKKLEEPKTAEGFSKVQKVNFIAGPFENDEDKEMFYCLVSAKK